jgi:hypothetical protein
MMAVITYKHCHCIPALHHDGSHQIQALSLNSSIVMMAVITYQPCHCIPTLLFVLYKKEQKEPFALHALLLLKKKT